MSSAFKKSLLNYFPTPRILTRPAVGFEVSPEALRFIEIIDHPKGKRVGRFAERRLPQTDTDDENFLKGERLKKIAEELVAEYHLENIRAVLPEEKIYLFSTDMPKLSKEEIRGSLELKLEENVPIPAKEAVFDYQIIPSLSNNPDRIGVSVSVAPRLVVTRYLDFFRELGLNALTLEVSAQSIAKAVIPRDDKSASIVVNLESRQTSFYIIDDGIVHFTSTIAVGGASLTEAVKKHFKVSAAEAEKVKMEQGIVKDKENVELFFSMVSTLSVLKDEVNKLISYWDTHRDRYTESNKNISKIIMCGRESSLRGLVEYLSSGLSVPVQLANVWTNVVSLDDYIPPVTFEDSLNYAAVIGLSV